LEGRNEVDREGRRDGRRVMDGAKESKGKKRSRSR
jgi:hypothetical protein